MSLSADTRNSAMFFVLLLVLLVPSFMLSQTLVPGTAVLLSNTTSSGGGGNGGNTSSASNSTNIFSPASYVDYHEVGGEPTTIVDRNALSSSFTCQAAASGLPDLVTACQSEAACPTGVTSCYHDLVYVSNPIGLPTYREFYQSPDGGQTLRVPPHNPY